MTTRRQLKELFKNIAESHKQINSFGWGDVPEILSRQDHIYPLMMVTPSDVINEQGQIKHTYIISVADRLKKDISNQVDVDNDTQQIMADLIAIFYNIDYQNLSVELPLNITPFKNIDPQDVIGWYGTFSLIVDENYDYCAVPSEPIPFDPDPPFDCAPAFYRVQYVGGELIQEGTIPSGGSVLVNVPLCPESGSVEWELRDEDNNLLDSGTQPAGIPLTITAPDGLITIKDTDDGVLYVVNINSGGAVSQIINDSTVNVNKSDGSLIFAQDVKAEGVENYNVPDSSITVRNSDNVIVDSGNVKATESGNFTAPDASVTVNGDASFGTIPSGGSENILVENTDGAPVGAFDGNTNSWVIADGTLNVNKSDGSLISARTLAAEETAGYNVADSTITNDATTPTYTQAVKATENLVLPAQTINVNSVNEGSINSVGTIDVSVKDQSNNDITPDSVAVTGRNINLVINVGGAPPIGDHLVRYFDIDGTILKEEYVNNGNNATPPANPNFDPTYLTFNSWNISSNNITRDMDIGAIYDTIDGKTYLFVRITDTTGLTPAIRLTKATTDLLTIDWGDSTTSTSSSSGDVTLTKGAAYSAIGDYVISIDCAGVYQNTDLVSILNNVAAYNQSLLAAYMGTNMRVRRQIYNGCNFLSLVSINADFATGQSTFYSRNMFENCTSLPHANVPPTATAMEMNSFFDFNRRLKTVSLPDTFATFTATFRSTTILKKVTTLFSAFGNNMFQDSGIEELYYSNSITLINNSAFSGVLGLNKFVAPTSTITVDFNALNNSPSLEIVELPATVTAINGASMTGILALKELVVLAVTPPTIASNTFNTITIKSITKIYVPDASVAAYKAATNWVTYQNNIYPLSTRP